AAPALLSGGTSTFASITAGHDSSILFQAAADVVVKGRMSLAAHVTIDAVAGITTKHKLFFVHGANGSNALQSAVSSVSIAKDSIIRATFYAPNGSIVVDQNVNVNGSPLVRDVRMGRANTRPLRMRF